jgi:D-beta-D-heptose 7-phosphate kinase/D-beta-D-heptose 1-phosphate adenosyltransferase
MLATKKIIVLGDVMIDINYMSFTPPTRVAPESSSVGIHKVNKTTHILGGAANVAAGFAELGFQVYLFGVIGEDDFYGTVIQNMISKKGNTPAATARGGNIVDYLSVDSSRPTTQKHRHFLNNVLTTRFDIENTSPISFENSVKGEIKRLIDKENIDAIVFSDYNKGYLTPDLCKYVIFEANKQGIYTFVDPKIKDCQKYNHCFCFKPNSSEASLISNEGLLDNHISGGETGGKIQSIVKSIHKVVNSHYYLITDGANGLFICSPPIDDGGDSGSASLLPPPPPDFHICHYKHTEAIDVRDVTGAGDTVMVVFVATFLQKLDICFAAKVANIMGGKSVRVLGNYTITLSALQEVIKTTQIKPKLPSTIFSAAQIRAAADEDGRTIVFTNGCFDILHSGHLRLLNYAKSCGNILVVGLNTDQSIRRIKGESRPINDQNERYTALTELRGIVDYVMFFSEDTPIHLIQLLRPDVIVKGGDYTPEQVVGREYAKRVDIFPYIDGKSTTRVIEAARAN